MDPDIIICKLCESIISNSNVDIDIVCCGNCPNVYYFHEECINIMHSFLCDQCKCVMYRENDNNLIEVPHESPPTQDIGENIPPLEQEPEPEPEPIPQPIPQPILSANVPVEEQSSQVDITGDNFCNICGDADSLAENPLITTSCNHIYHYNCLLDWFNNCNKKRECPYCREKYKPIPQIDDKKYINLFNVINRSIMKDLCLSEDGCPNRGYPGLEGLCFFDYEKMITYKYYYNRSKFIEQEKAVLNVLFAKCSALIKNGAKCSNNTKYIHNNKPYCNKHYSAIGSVSAIGSDMENGENNNIISAYSMCSYNHSCNRKITIISGNVQLCKKHFDNRLNAVYDHAHLAYLNAEYDLLYNIKLNESKKYCAGYKHNGKKCFNLLSGKMSKYCCNNHSQRKPKWLVNSCYGHHPITNERCKNPPYDETLLCILHTPKLDHEYSIN